jgi:hypothetical protein
MLKQKEEEYGTKIIMKEKFPRVRASGNLAQGSQDCTRAKFHV